MKQKNADNKLKNILTNYWPLFGYFLISIIFLFPILLQHGMPFKYDWNWPLFDMNYSWSNLFATGRFGIFSALGKYATLLLGLPSIIKLSPELSLKLFLLSIHTLAGYGFYLFAEKRTGSKVASFIAGIAYAFSPYIFIRTIIGFNLASIAYAAIPFFLNFYLAETKKSILRWFWVALLFSLIFSQIQSGLLLLLILLVDVFISTNWETVRNKVKSLFLLLVFTVAVNIPWLVLTFIGRESVPEISAGQSTTLNYIASMPHSLRNTLMLSDHIITRDFFYPFSHEKIILIGFILVYCIAALAFINKKTRRLASVLAISALLVLPFSIGPTGAFTMFYTKFFTRFPQIALFRETYHFEFIISFVLITLFTFGLSQIFDWLKNYRPGFILIRALAAMSIIVIIAPYFSGDYAGYFQLRPTPKEYENLYQFAKENKSYCQKAYYPPSLGFIYYIDDPTPDALNSDILADQIGFPYVSASASVLDNADMNYFYRNFLTSQFLESSDNGEFAQILRDGGVDCVIVRTDIWTKFWRVTNIWRDDTLAVREKWMNPDMLSLVLSKKNLRLDRQFGDNIYVYKISESGIGSKTDSKIEKKPVGTELSISDWANNYDWYKEGWSRGRYAFWRKNLFAELQQDFIYTDKSGSILSGKVETDGNYDLVVRYLDGGTVGEVNINIAGKDFLLKKSPGEEKFIVKNLGKVTVKNGDQIEIKNIDGENAIADIVLVSN